MANPTSFSVLGTSFDSEETALTALKAEVLRIEELKTQRLKDELLVLPSRFGVETIDGFIQLLAEHASPELKQRLLVSHTTSQSRRRRLSPEERNGIIAGLQAGERGVDLAARFQVTSATIQTIKRSLGLVRSQQT